MAQRTRILAGLAGMLACAAVAVAGENTTAPLPVAPDDGAVGRAAASQPNADRGPGAASRDVQPALDPSAFFDQLVKRYKGLHLYRDSVRLVQVTTRDGAEPTRVETEIGCEVHDNDLHVKTPSSIARHATGMDLPVRPSPAAAAAQRGYDLWLAPHMALKFDDEPLKHFRAGVDEGFTPTGADAVTIDNRKMVHVALRSGDGLSENCTARFDLFINPETMLVERIDGEQKMPDGGSCTTSLQITPREVDGGDPTTIMQ